MAPLLACSQPSLSGVYYNEQYHSLCTPGNRKMLCPEFPGPGKAFCRHLSSEGLYQPSRLWLGFLLRYKICSRFVFKWFSLRSTVVCLFLRHRTFCHCLLVQSDSSVDSARFCSCTCCLQVFQK